MITEGAIAGLTAMALFGFTGSLHCAAMCGAMATSACTPAGAGTHGSALVQYHATRVVAYGLLGCAAGLLTALAVGRWIAVAAPYLGVAFGGVMALHASRELLRALHPTTMSAATASQPPRWGRLAATLQRSILRLPLPRAVAFGLATALLPCGFLLAALLQASLLAHPVHAALGMMLFAIASSPALLAATGLMAFVHRRAPRAAPAIAAGLLLASSLVIVWRALAHPHVHHAHHGHAQPVSGSDH